MSENIDIQQIQKDLVTFAKERDWEKFHTPKNLIMALAGETGELTEIFQWLSESESKNVMGNEHIAENVRDELSDVMIYCLRLATVLDIDIEQAMIEKMKKNAAKYPVHLAKGHATKYTDL